MSRKQGQYPDFQGHNSRTGARLRLSDPVFIVESMQSRTDPEPDWAS